MYFIENFLQELESAKQFYLPVVRAAKSIEIHERAIIDY